jgi:hypothetical protein
MKLILSDWLIVAIYFIVSAAIGLAYTRKASRSLEDYFVTGRTLPWWLAGTSMVATTFAADTPLVVAGLVAKYGVAGNWLWWNGAFSGVLTVFFFARLWRRAGVLTDVEFAELRYGGRPAAVLRGFRALYLALPINLIIMGWVTRAMVTILGVTLDVNPWRAAILLLGITALYSIFSGLWGVIVTDAFQFVVAMGGTILLAVFAVESVGGLGVLTEKAAAHFGSADAAFGVLPSVDQAWLPLSTLLIFLGVQWWAAWYPGQEPGGGGYVVQRILSAKDERHGLLATLWFTIAHYALRPWPWILVGFVGSDPLPEPGQSGRRLCPGDGGCAPLSLQGVAARGLCRGLHEHDQHPPQLGRFLPGERCVPPLSQAEGQPASAGHRFQVGHPRADVALTRRDELSQYCRAGLEASDWAWCGDRPRVHPPVVLVAGECLVGNQCHDRLVRDVGRPCHLRVRSRQPC